LKIFIYNNKNVILLAKHVHTRNVMRNCTYFVDIMPNNICIYSLNLK